MAEPQEAKKQVKLKPLPSTLKSAFLDSDFNYLAIISASLTELEEENF